MSDMITLDGKNSTENIAKKLAVNFGRYKRGEISKEECERLDKEFLDIVRKEKNEALNLLKEGANE
jgi:hypothetical protein